MDWNKSIHYDTLDELTKFVNGLDDESKKFLIHVSDTNTDFDYVGYGLCKEKHGQYRYNTPPNERYDTFDSDSITIRGSTIIIRDAYKANKIRGRIDM